MHTKLLQVLVAGGAATLLATACQFVTIDPEGEPVQVVTADAVEDCTRVGRTRVEVAHRVLFFPRSEERIRRDLDTLARNSGADLGGDTIHLDGDIVDGRATYQVYRCN